jgi:hypothetical protein
LDAADVVILGGSLSNGEGTAGLIVFVAGERRCGEAGRKASWDFAGALGFFEVIRAGSWMMGDDGFARLGAEVSVSVGAKG